MIEGNRVYVVGRGGGATLYAFNVESGQKLWSVGSDFGQMPAVAGGKVFTNYVSAKLSAYRTADGTQLWTVGGGWSSGNRYNAMAVGNRVFAVSGEYDTWVVAKDAETGKELWRRTDKRIMESMPLASDGPLVWVTIKGGVMALDSATGAVKREVTLGEKENYAGAPVVGKTHLFVPMGGKIWAVDRQTGAAAELAAGQGPLALVVNRLYFLTLQDEQSGQATLAALESVAK